MREIKVYHSPGTEEYKGDRSFTTQKNAGLKTLTVTATAAARSHYSAVRSRRSGPIAMPIFFVLRPGLVAMPNRPRG
jgi:hypothetical protein